jgi:hypothetical protein
VVGEVIAETPKVTATPTLQETPKAAPTVPPRSLRGVTGRPKPRELSADAVAGIEFSKNNQEEKMQNYRRINYDLKVYEDEYTNCISEIPGEGFSQDEVDACTGRDMIKVALDIKYVTMRTMSKMDTRIKELFIDHCFQPHLHDEILTVGCDIMERDALNLMWAGLNFFLIIEANKQKYLYEYARLPFDLFQKLLNELIELGGEFFELINEIDNHKEVTILRLKTLVDDRLKLRKEDDEATEPFVTSRLSHVIEIQESGPVHTPAFEIENQHISQFNTEGGYEETDERKLGVAPKVTDQDARRSSSRIFNSNGKYSGLHARSSEGRVFGQSRFPKNQALRMSLVGRLSKADRAQGKVAFKNIHTKHYSG